VQGLTRSEGQSVVPCLQPENPGSILAYLPFRLTALIAVLFLAACGAPRTESPAVTPGYEGVEDNGYFIAPVEARYLPEGVPRAEVDYAGGEAPGTIVIDTFARRLYLVLPGGRAWRYKIGIGREGTSLTRGGTIGRTEIWPGWQPTGNMLRTYPELYGPYAGGVAGGLDSPLGARALYLHRGGRDTMYRIHGTIDDASIGRASSAGCVRLFNQDAIHLYNQVEPGALVKVRSFDESLAMEGPWMNDINGNAVPDTPENRAALEKALARRAERDAATAAAAGDPATQG
jgi:lipoprotein-anchoring transpeptidase ErfK/SrfK